jgi:hypothetical protein
MVHTCGLGSTLLLSYPGEILAEGYLANIDENKADMIFHMLPIHTTPEN